MKTAIITVGSVTYAIKAKKLLLHEGISARLVKSGGDPSGHGCAHGIEIPAKEIYAAAAVLRAAGLDYRMYEK